MHGHIFKNKCTVRSKNLICLVSAQKWFCEGYHVCYHSKHTYIIEYINAINMHVVGSEA